jgi:voltage-gated potassium channel Kch
MKRPFVVIDYDPGVIDRLEREGVNYIYGDALDLELMDEAGVPKAKLIAATITDHDTNRFLVQQVTQMNPRAVLIVHSDSPEQATELYKLGATYVMMPHYIGTEKIGSFIRKNGFKKSEFKKFRDKYLPDVEID